MDFRVTTLSQQLSPSGSVCTVLSLHVPGQKTICPVHCPSVGPSLQDLSLWGSKPLLNPASPGPTWAPVHMGNRARSPKCPNAKNAGGESLHQALKPCTNSPHTKRVPSPYVLQRCRSLQLSIPGHGSAPRISHVSVLDQVGPCSSVSSTTISSMQTDLMADPSEDLL